MSFRPSAEITVERSITVSDPEIGPAPTDPKVTVEFRILRNSAAAALQARLRQPPVRTPDQTDESWLATQEAYLARLRNFDAEFLKEVIVGWPAVSGLEDEQGQPLAFAPAALEAALDHPWFLAAAIAAYNRAVIGARRGN